MYIDPKKIFANVEHARESGELRKNVTSAKYAYQASEHSGLIEEINRTTGERRTGKFYDGSFHPVEL